ncbi:MAG: NAD-dependent epimerase [Bacteroidales bacterium]|nr:NAD-dependent epimerase [Bacteroidales bacterium]
MKILVTGAAGFIGSKLVQRLAERGNEVVGLDNINDYYDARLKYGRLEALTGISRDNIKEGVLTESFLYPNYRFVKMDIEDKTELLRLFKQEKFDKVCHLAAQAGVRYSIENPYVYINSNIAGFLNILEAARHNHIQHLVYGSSSSVYGANAKAPFSEKDGAAHPVSLYAATKKSNELMAHSYSSLYNLPTTGLRFFTVYGPWGRPDMAPFLFTDAIMNNRPIKVFNNGDLLRDFTYIDDIVEGVIRVIDKTPEADSCWDSKKPNPDSSHAPYRIYNIGNSVPVNLIDFIHSIEVSTSKTAEKIFLPMQQGDVYQTNASMSSLEETFGYKPSTNILEGVKKFVNWYKEFYQVKND